DQTLKEAVQIYGRKWTKIMERYFLDRTPSLGRKVDLRMLHYPAPKHGKPLNHPPTPAHRDAVSVAVLFCCVLISARPHEDALMRSFKTAKIPLVKASKGEAPTAKQWGINEVLKTVHNIRTQNGEPLDQ
ncbi:hypothetical protein MMC14_009708, partial [Varicellaria rhodocarpa]|nr:hypothetical protein [Varicellaria rhodocarpa]